MIRGVLVFIEIFRVVLFRRRGLFFVGGIGVVGGGLEDFFFGGGVGFVFFILLIGVIVGVVLMGFIYGVKEVIIFRLDLLDGKFSSFVRFIFVVVIGVFVIFDGEI